MSKFMSLDTPSLSAFKNISKEKQSTFWKLWIRHRDFLFRQCLKWLKGNHFDAEEVLSTVMFKFAEQFPSQGDKLKNIKAWLTRIAYNLAMDFYRKKQKEVNYGHHLETFSLLEPSYLISSSSPDTLLCNQELRRILWQGIECLPLSLKSPFILRYYHDLSTLKIAQRLGLSLENVYKRIKKAKALLQKYLKPYLLGLSLSFTTFASLGESFPQDKTSSFQQYSSFSPLDSLEKFPLSLLSCPKEIFVFFHNNLINF